MDIGNFIKFVRLIESADLSYMITGSIASILYGRPRLTQDMDVVLAIPPEKAKAFAALFDARDYYCPPEETIAEEIGRGGSGHFNVIDQATGFKIDIYPGGDDPLIAWGLGRKKRVELLEGQSAWVAPPEYVILKKLAYYAEGRSEKHLEDIRGMLDVVGEQIDILAIEGWARQLGVAELWNTVGRRSQREHGRQR